MRYTQPQSGPLTIRRGNALGAKVIDSFPLSGTNLSVVTRTPIVYGPSGSTAATIKGKGLRGQGGSGARASLNLDLTSYAGLSIAFWMYWDAFANDDALAFEFTSNGATSNSGGFAFNPNSSGPGAGKLVFFGATTGSANLFASSWPRPTAAAWHRYLLSFDISGNVELYIDGALQSKVVELSPTQSGNFASSTLNLLSRNGSTLFATGNLQDLTLYRAMLSGAEAKQDWQNPWQIFEAPSRRLWAAATGSPQSYSYTTSGGLVFSGIAPVVRKIARAAAGGIVFAGVSVRRAVRVVVPAGGIQLSGNAGMLRRAARAAAGGLALAGAATVSFTSSVQSIVVVAAGGMLLRGVATVLRTISRRAAGGINLSGEATVTSTDRTAPVRLNLYTIMRADSINIAADLAASVNLTTAFGTAQVDLYTIMRNDPINITAPLGASINLTGNLL